MDRRIPMIAGIAFAVLFAAALLMVPTLPGIDKRATTHSGPTTKAGARHWNLWSSTWS